MFWALLCFVFFRSMRIFLIVLPLGVCYPLLIVEDLKKKRQDLLLIQFKDMILSLSGCLNAGYSVGNAFEETLREMDRVYGPGSMISEEIRLLLHKTGVNRTLEDALMDFAKRSGLEEIRSFAEVFLEAKASGGELMKIIRRTANTISEKIRIRQDIITATTSRRLEHKIMSAIPLGIVLYLEMISPGFFDVLYTASGGRMIMTGCLALYLGSLIWGKKLLDTGM